MSCANERRILFNPSHAMANSILALHVDGGVVAALRRRPADHGVQPTTAGSSHARPTCSQASNVAARRHGHDCSIELKTMGQPIEDHETFASGVLHTILNYGVEGGHAPTPSAVHTVHTGKQNLQQHLSLSKNLQPWPVHIRRAVQGLLIPPMYGGRKPAWRPRGACTRRVPVCILPHHALPLQLGPVHTFALARGCC